MPVSTPKAPARLLHVLIIEDTEDHLELTREALEEAGVQNPVTVATSLQEARTHLETCQDEGSKLPCVILLDIRLPDGSGMELLREIKQSAALRTVPVVILTSSEDTPDINRAYLLGANSYLVKPVVFAEFHQKIREAGLYWALLNRSYQG
jgi:two-component system, response regulator